ncbi:uncharacterized protein PGTG_17609 [Puccinia graminis f. sp. tritici CRL 75-36-700-3]|uniref:Uncharacterized protein n=2 Tax=Puccinia graminis f. sp. tritici TaxID=56615 RepID=E3L4T0_PUCGT|nr:uncharacterized protein PGTG_17609 [Puccinia graminis f. sp. tritici CRL 75-36-700-3]EFP91555.2 hypothetical protein PGTG_17609 [Puccinia graminis f. sp. tritici CRL 75-36-700-3]
MTQFQANSLALHRGLIKWDKLKAHDQSFTQPLIRLALQLQRFMNQMDDYFRIPQDHPPPSHLHHLQHQHHEQQEEPSTQITPSPISLNKAFAEIITTDPSACLRIEEDPSA